LQLNTIITIFPNFKDLNDPSILGLIEANMVHNNEHIKSEFLVKPLDFLNLSWDSELEKAVAEADIILAADGNRI
jgi:hypothetical protein